MMGNKKLQVWLPLLFSMVMILGMFFGYRLAGGREFLKTGRQSSLQETLDLIRLHYVDAVNVDSLQSGAIQDIMNQLDPHSVYFPPVQVQQANEDLEGQFDGIGVEFNIFKDTVHVMYVVPEGPSDKAGLQIGDRILAVNDSSLTSPGISSDKIKEFIRGRSGSLARLSILRKGAKMDVEVARGAIPVPSIDASYMINERTGYIKLNKFTQRSYEEFMAALENLQSQGMKELIYDLRGNGGGFMNEAFDMADEFLSGDKLVVYTEGANSRKEEYRCRRPGLFEEGKLVILIDETSASASEVLAGALQDWDRAIVLGRRSFGKGLVQLQYNLTDGSAIRLTTARYYTPLGRSIQRPYDKGKKVYMDELWERYNNGEVLFADSNKVSNGKRYITPGGDTLYGGGGIMPDVFVSIDTSSYPRQINQLFLSGRVNNFVYRFYLQHRDEIDKLESLNAFEQRFANRQDMWTGFAQEMADENIELPVLNDSTRQSLERRMTAFLARFRWRNTGYFQIMNKEEKEVQRALELLK